MILRNRKSRFIIAIIIVITILFSLICTGCKTEEENGETFKDYISDAEFYADTPNIIVPNSAKIETSSNFESENWNLKFAADGKTNDTVAKGWSSQKSSTSEAAEWILMDMRRTHYTDRISIYPAIKDDSSFYSLPSDFTISVSRDKINWIPVIDESEYETGDGENVFRIAAQNIRYIRIDSSKLNKDDAEEDYFMRIGEIKTYYDRYILRPKYLATTGATYYISSSYGNDENDGLSEDSPWKTLHRASFYEYSPDSKILLKNGDIWENETLFVNTNKGNEPVDESNHVVISAYGEGAKPVIRPGHGAGYGIKLQNASGVKISGISFDYGIAGILATAYETVDNDFLWIEECDFTNFESLYEVDPSNFLMPYPELYFGTGIGIAAIGNQETSQKTYYRNITIIDCDFDRNDTGILNQFRDTPMQMNGYPTTGHLQFSRNSIENLTIRNVNVTKSYRSGGIMLYGVKNGLIEDSFVSETGFEKGMFWGVAGVQLSMCEDFLVQNSEFTKTYRSNNSPDGEGFDFESGNVNVTLYNCYIHDNQGPSILYYGQNEGWRGANEGIVIDSNILENNGEKGKFDHSKVFKNYPQNEGIIKNNIIRLKFDAQSITYEPLIYSETNFVFETDGTQISGPGLNRISSSDVAFSYTGSWEIVAGDNYFQGEAMVAKEPDSSVSFNMRGNVLNIFGKNPGNSPTKLNINIEGKLVETINIEPMETIDLIYENTELSGDVHNVKLEVKTGMLTLDSIDYFIGETRPQTGRTNHALNAVVEASSSEEGFGWSKDFVNNGIRNSLHPSIIGWSSVYTTDRTAQEWILFDLKEVKSIDSIRLYAVDLSPSYFNIVMGISFPMDFEIAVSNDKINWNTLTSETGYPQPVKNTHIFNLNNTTQGRYVRITGKRLRADPFDNNKYKMQFAEVEIIEFSKD